MVFKLGALLILVAQVCTTWALPPCVCGRNLLQVCGSDGVTYSNQCLLECKAITSNTQITMTKIGPCDSPLPDVCVCTLNYAPVCGSDGQTYSNECGLNCHKSRFNQGLMVQHYGPCNTHLQPTTACPANYSPVCGSDGNTYGNDCLLNAATSTNSGLSIAHFGTCQDRVIVNNI